MIELEFIDCNCNNCKFMTRDFDRFNYWMEWHKGIELADFEKAKAKAIAEAESIEEPAAREGQLRSANKMKFQFDKSKLLNYGVCAFYGKKVSFIPNICQLETQGCFQHRRL